MSAAPLVSVLIVNYNTAALTRRCVASLRAQRMPSADGSVTPIEIVVVDNASRREERRALAAIDALVLYNDENLGYGAALNQALAHASGEFILFSNSDTWYCPDVLQKLLDGFLQFPRCAAVGPRLWWDHEQTFLLPPSDPVTLTRYLFEARLSRWRRGRWWLEHTWRRSALRYWRLHASSPQSMLSGASLLTHRDIVAACGGFDERFRLYYEDTDWCRRVRRKGYRLYYVPTANVVHLHNQSARQEVSVARHAGKESERRYLQKYYGKWWRMNVGEVAAQWRMREDNTRPHGAGIDLGLCFDSPVFSLPIPLVGEHLWQLSPFPSCVPAIARFVAGNDELVLPATVWAQLGEGEFFARLFSLPDLRLVQQWRWRKVCSPG